MSDEIQQKYCFEYKIPLTFSLNMKIPLKKSPRRSLVVNMKLCRSIFSNVTPGALRQFSESHNEPQIGNCSLNRRLPKMWTYITTRLSLKGGTGNRGNGESGKRGNGESGNRGNGESGNRGNGESEKRKNGNALRFSIGK